MENLTHSSLCDCETCNQQVRCTSVRDLADESSHLTQGMEPAGVRVGTEEPAPQDIPMSTDEEPKAEDFIKPMEGKFRLRGKSFFLTYPHCEWPADTLIGWLRETHTWKKELTQWMAVRENHKDGTPHLHAIVEYSKQKETTSPKIFDIPTEPFHGNYGLVKSYPAAVRYLMKTGQPVANWDYAAYVKKQTRKGNLAVDYTEVNQMAIKEGVKSLVEAGKIPLQTYHQWQRGLAAYEADIAKIQPVDHFTLKLPISYTPHQEITRFIDLKDKTRRHYWFFGSTGTGKTYTAEHQEIPHYVVPKNNDWIGYNGAQLLIVNEFKGELTPTQIIDIMESRQQNVKGSSAKLPDDVCLIVTSNYSLRDCFKNLNADHDPQLDALERRFTEVLFNNPHPSCPQGRDLLVLDATASLQPPTDEQAKNIRRKRQGGPLSSEPIKKFKADNGIIDLSD